MKTIFFSDAVELKASKGIIRQQQFAEKIKHHLIIDNALMCASLIVLLAAFCTFFFS